MSGLMPILVAILTGFISGLVLSVPVGPVNLTILNEGARRGFRWAFLIGLGATVMEVIYCFIAFTGFAPYLQLEFIKLAMEWFSVVFLAFLGVRFLLAKSVESAPMPLRATHRLQARLEEQLHPQSAFTMGLVQVMGNLGVLVFWVILATHFMLRGWVRPDWPGKLACVGSVGVAICLWFTFLSWMVAKRQGKFSDATLYRIERYSGVFLVGLALIRGVLLIWTLVGKK
jgi:threonine/homoserine/homoserine lactone efflux protein